MGSFEIRRVSTLLPRVHALDFPTTLCEVHLTTHCTVFTKSTKYPLLAPWSSLLDLRLFFARFAEYSFTSAEGLRPSKIGKLTGV